MTTSTPPPATPERQLTTTVSLIASLLGCIISLVLFELVKTPRPIGTAGIVALELSFTAARFAEIFGSWGEQARALFGWGLAIDLLFPLAYGALLSGLVWRLGRPLPWRRVITSIGWLPLIAAGLDYVENAFLYVLWRAWPTVSPALVLGESLVSAVKWALAATAIIAIGVVVVVRLATHQLSPQTDNRTVHPDQPSRR